MENQLDITVEMLNSVTKLDTSDLDLDDDGKSRVITEFDGYNDNHWEVEDEALNLAVQTVTIRKYKGGKLMGALQFPAADFELLVELMSLEARGMRKINPV